MYATHRNDSKHRFSKDRRVFQKIADSADPRLTTYKPLRLFSSDYYFSLFCGSFSAVSKPNFASKYLFCSIFQDLHNEHAFAPPTTKNLQTFAQVCKFLMTFPDFRKILLKFDEIVLFFGENFTEFRRNSRESQLIYGNSDFLKKIRKIVLEFWHNFDDRSSDNRQSSDYFPVVVDNRQRGL